VKERLRQVHLDNPAELPNWSVVRIGRRIFIRRRIALERRIKVGWRIALERRFKVGWRIAFGIRVYRSLGEKADVEKRIFKETDVGGIHLISPY
jgi:hypothetical protein